LNPFFSFFIFILCLTQGAWGRSPQLWNEFSAHQWASLEAGKPVVSEEDVPESSWPRVTIAYLLNCTPSEAASVFWNSELDPEYLPDCLSAHILSSPSPHVQEVEFHLKMPFFLPEEVYVSRVEVTRSSTGGYEISWNVSQLIYAKTCRGSVLIEPHDGKTLLISKNSVIPKGELAGFLRFPAVLRQKESVHALVRQIQLEKKQHPNLLAKQQEALAQALGGR
jgi:hypothetical protein